MQSGVKGSKTASVRQTIGSSSKAPEKASLDSLFNFGDSVNSVK